MNAASSRRCDHDSEMPFDVLNELPTSQAGSGRHRCAVCAYAAGLADGLSGATSGKFEVCQHDSRAPVAILSSLPNSQGGDERHKCTNCAYKLGYNMGANANQIASDALDTERAAHELPADFTPQTEGQKKLRTHIVYERSSINRARAIELQGTLCAACGFDFDAVYGGAFARHYIEIHHVESVTTLAGRVVDPERDLVPLCFNCHSMAHRQSGRILSVEELRELLKTAREAKELHPNG